MPLTIGQKLTQARLARNETLEQVSKNLHIRVKYLSALETGERQDLPSDVQAKGFLRLYAGHLGLPIKPLLDAWQRNAPLQDELTAEQTPVIEAAMIEPEITQVEPPNAHANGNLPAGEEISSEAAVEHPAQPSLTGHQKILQEIGRQLHSQRTSLGLKLSEVERYTHVRQHYLQALENGKIEDLPSPVQARGMLQNYAQFLDLDADSILLRFADALQTRRAERTDLPAGKPAKKLRVKGPLAPYSLRRLITPDLIVITVLIIGLVIFALWSANQVGALLSRQQDATPPSISEVLLQTATGASGPTATPSLGANQGTRAPAESGTTPLPPTTAPGKNITVPASASGTLQVVVVALQRSYMRVSVNSNVVFDGRIVPGNPYTYSSDQKIELLVGNAAAVQVIFNQRDLGNLGLVGQVKAIVFTKNGAFTPTPVFTPTATRTQPPTATMRPSPTLPTPTITPFIP